MLKEEFLDYIDFIIHQRELENALVEALENMCPGNYCSAFVYDAYEDKLVSLLTEVMHDDTGLIEYRLYEYESYSDTQKEETLKESPELASWSTVYDYLDMKSREVRDESKD